MAATRPMSAGGATSRIGRQTTAVTAETVIQIPEVYDCLTVLSQSIAQLPFFVYRGRRRLTAASGSATIR